MACMHIGQHLICTHVYTSLCLTASAQSNTYAITRQYFNIIFVLSSLIVARRQFFSLPLRSEVASPARNVLNVSKNNWVFVKYYIMWQSKQLKCLEQRLLFIYHVAVEKHGRPGGGVKLRGTLEHGQYFTIRRRFWLHFFDLGGWKFKDSLYLRNQSHFLDQRSCDHEFARNAAWHRIRGAPRK